MQMLKLHC